MSYPPNDGSQWDEYDWESFALYGYGDDLYYGDDD